MPPRRQIHVLAQEDFERLLAWLHEDREQAGVAYEQIRRRLITIFAARSCATPEDLADETLDRVARRVSDIAQSYSGEKSLYFFGVANNVHHEYLKRPSQPEPQPEITTEAGDQERTHDCLEECLEKLAEDSRKILLRYYSQEKQAKIHLHKEMAEELGITINTLRLRVLRMKEKLQPCIEKCLERSELF